MERIFGYCDERLGQLVGSKDEDHAPALPDSYSKICPATD
jgi:hypothetical protein